MGNSQKAVLSGHGRLCSNEFPSYAPCTTYRGAIRKEEVVFAESPSNFLASLAFEDLCALKERGAELLKYFLSLPLSFLVPEDLRGRVVEGCASVPFVIRQSDDASASKVWGRGEGEGFPLPICSAELCLIGQSHLASETWKLEGLKKPVLCIIRNLEEV